MKEEPFGGAASPAAGSLGVHGMLHTFAPATAPTIGPSSAGAAEHDDTGRGSSTASGAETCFSGGAAAARPMKRPRSSPSSERTQGIRRLSHARCQATIQASCALAERLGDEALSTEAPLPGSDEYITYVRGNDGKPVYPMETRLEVFKARTILASKEKEERFGKLILDHAVNTGKTEQERNAEMIDLLNATWSRQNTLRDMAASMLRDAAGHETEQAWKQELDEAQNRIKVTELALKIWKQRLQAPSAAGAPSKAVCPEPTSLGSP